MGLPRFTRNDISFYIVLNKGLINQTQISLVFKLLSGLIHFPRYSLNNLSMLWSGLDCGHLYIRNRKGNHHKTVLT